MLKKFFSKKDFNFETYLVDSLKYTKHIEYNHNYYTNGLKKISVHKKERGGYNLVTIDLEDVEMVTLMFIPNSQTMVDMILSSIQIEFYSDTNETV